MSITNLLPIDTTAPATTSKQLKTIVNNSFLKGQYLPSTVAGYPKNRFPRVEDLGLQQVLSSNSQDVFPFKNPTMPLTDIEVPTTILVLDRATSKIILQTNKFILQSITKPMQERFQIIETFGQPSVYFYGDRTRVYTLQGTLIDANDVTLVNEGTSKPASAYHWATAFQQFYEDHLRGTKLKSAGYVAALYVNNWFIKGYPIQLVISKESANSPTTASFQMTWVIERESLILKEQSKWLFNKTAVSAAVAAAINVYLAEQAVYEKKYEAWSNASGTDEEIQKLANEKDNALKNVLAALAKLQLLLSAES